MHDAGKPLPQRRSHPSHGRAGAIPDCSLSLAQGRPGFAAIDVFETKPLPAGSPLLHAGNVLATPHLGDVEKNGYGLYLGTAFRNVVDFASGTPKNVLNPAALERAQAPVPLLSRQGLRQP